MLLIFEGVLRKWVAPQFGKPLFFIRDPFVLIVYWLVLTGTLKLSRSLLLLGGIVLAAGSFVVLVGHQILGGLVPAYLAAYGWRNYFFYIPLVFVIQRYLRREDMALLIKRTLLTAIPMAMLVVAQVSSPPFSVINAGSGDNPEETYSNPEFVLAGGIVRPSGTFTSNLGLTAFVASAVALNVAMWLTAGSSRIIGKSWLFASTISTTICLALSGSRGAMLWSGVVLVACIGGLLVTNSRMGIRAMCVTALLACFGLVTMPLAFPKQTDAFVSRWTEAGESEQRAFGGGGVFSRALDEIVRFRILIDGTPLFGYGLGSAGNAAWRFGTREIIIPFASEEELGAAETDWGRNILELGPIIGSLMIGYRAIFTVYLGFTCLLSTKRSGDPLPWLLFSYAGSQLLYGEITAHGTMNGYIWLFTGLCLSACSSANCLFNRRSSAANDRSYETPFLFVSQPDGRHRLLTA